MSDSDDDPEISDLELDFSDAGTNKKKKKKKKKKEKKKKKDKPEQIVWEEYIEYNELGQEVIRFKHKKSGEIIDDCPGQLYQTGREMNTVSSASVYWTRVSPHGGNGTSNIKFMT